MLITLRLAVFSEMLTVIKWDSWYGGRWKCCDVVLYAGCNQSMWMGVCGMTDLGTSPGQMSVIPDGTAAFGEVIIQMFGAIVLCKEVHFIWNV